MKTYSENITKAFNKYYEAVSDNNISVRSLNLRLNKLHNECKKEGLNFMDVCTDLMPKQSIKQINY